MWGRGRRRGGDGGCGEGGGDSECGTSMTSLTFVMSPTHPPTSSSSFPTFTISSPFPTPTISSLTFIFFSFSPGGSGRERHGGSGRGRHAGSGRGRHGDQEDSEEEEWLELAPMEDEQISQPHAVVTSHFLPPMYPESKQATLRCSERTNQQGLQPPLLPQEI